MKSEPLGLTVLACIRLDHLSFDERIEKIAAVRFQSAGLDVEKYIANLESLQEKELKPYSKVHYLISLDINHNDKIIKMLERLK